MQSAIRLSLLRLIPVILVTLAAGLWFNDVQDGGPYVARNLLPLFILFALSAAVLFVGNGHWSGADKRLPLGLVGYAIPALGLAVYLHYAYSINLNDMFADAEYRGELFRYLPIYTTVAGGIGFAIGWIIGRNV